MRPSLSPYKGEYVILRVNEAAQGREFLRRIVTYVAPAEDWWVPAWLGIAFSYQGLKACCAFQRNSALGGRRGLCPALIP
jgi:hypothetical protein